MSLDTVLANTQAGISALERRLKALTVLREERLQFAPPGVTAVQMYVADANNPTQQSFPIHAVMMDGDEWVWFRPGTSISPREGRWQDLIEEITKGGLYPEAMAVLAQARIVTFA